MHNCIVLNTNNKWEKILKENSTDLDQLSNLFVICTIKEYTQTSGARCTVMFIA